MSASGILQSMMDWWPVSQRKTTSVTKTNVPEAAPVWRRQREQWQFTIRSGGRSNSQVKAPQRKLLGVASGVDAARTGWSMPKGAFS